MKTLKLGEDVNSVVNNMAITYIVEYITDVLITYTVNYKLELGRYFNEVYLINADMWGIMSIYSELIESINLMSKMTETQHKIISRQMMNILIENLFKNGTKVINVTKLVNDIKNLNNYLMSISNKGSRRENFDRIRKSSMNVRSNMRKVNKHLTQNLAVFNKLEKYSNKLRGSGERQLNPQVGIVRGGYKTRKCGRK
jgi:hypothetical protein